jgi:hypothetical protein
MDNPAFTPGEDARLVDHMVSVIRRSLEGEDPRLAGLALAIALRRTAALDLLHDEDLDLIDDILSLFDDTARKYEPLDRVWRQARGRRP